MCVKRLASAGNMHTSHTRSGQLGKVFPNRSTSPPNIEKFHLVHTHKRTLPGRHVYTPAHVYLAHTRTLAGYACAAHPNICARIPLPTHARTPGGHACAAHPNICARIPLHTRTHTWWTRLRSAPRRWCRSPFFSLNTRSFGCSACEGVTERN